MRIKCEIMFVKQKKFSELRTKLEINREIDRIN